MTHCTVRRKWSWLFMNGCECKSCNWYRDWVFKLYPVATDAEVCSGAMLKGTGISVEYISCILNCKVFGFPLNCLPNLTHWISVKVKWSRYRPGVAQRVGRGIALLFHDCGSRRGWVVSSTPRPHFTPEKDPVPILQEARWAENLVPTGIRSRTVQPIVSRYTDWTTGPTLTEYILYIL